MQLGVAAIANSGEHSLVHGKGETLPLPDKPSIVCWRWPTWATIFSRNTSPIVQWKTSSPPSRASASCSSSPGISGFAYRGKSANIRAVGRERSVCYLLEGSIRKSTNRPANWSSGHVWADRFNGEMEDTFDLAGLHHGKPGRRHRAEPEARDRPGHRQAGRAARRLRPLFARMAVLQRKRVRGLGSRDCSAPTRAGERSDIYAREGSLGERLCHARSTRLRFAWRPGDENSTGAFAVGTPIAECPPRRSVRAEFPHTAPTSGV